jgi:hypothetical protein
MAISRTFTYLGKLKRARDGGEGKHIWMCRYDILATDTYLRATQIVMTFNGLSRITDLLGIYSTCCANVANVLASVSITNAAGAAPILQLEVMEGANVVAAEPFDEKPNAEAYGQEHSFFAVVAGI